MTATRIRLTLLVAAGVPLAGIFGCDGLARPESVLAGTWELIPSEPPNPEVSDWFLTFDSAGKMTELSFTFGDRTITWSDPRSSSSVDGDEVYISVMQNGQIIAFEGTLDSATEPSSAAGSVTAMVVVDDVEISDSKGEATLIKQ